MPLTADRNTPMSDSEIVVLGVGASTTLYAGGMIARNASGYGVPAADAAGLVVVGRGEEAVDNSAGANGALSVEVRRGKIFYFDNSATNALTVADLFTDCYVEDDETVSSDGGTNSIVAGKVMSVDDRGVGVLIG